MDRLMMEWTETRITDGLERADRSVAALQPDYFHVDEWLFSDLLAMAAQLAGNISFIDLNNALSGDWSELFTADEAVIMTMILSVDLKRAEADFSQAYQGGTQDLARFVLAWMKRVNLWLSKLSGLDNRSSIPLRRKIDVLVREQLSDELYAVCFILTPLEQGAESELDKVLADFVPAWRLSKQEESYLYTRSGPEASAQAQRKPRLHRAFYTVHNAIAYLKNLVPAYLRESLTSQRHAPAIGLYMAFLKLYERAQQKLNRFSQRHLHFYYHRVLHAGLLDQQPESVYLCFAAKPDSEAALIKSSTRFSAGKDQALKDIVYRTDNDLLVTDARVVSLRTLLMQHDSLISPETELGFVTRIKATRPPVQETETEQSMLSSWPLFGGGREEIGSQDAQIGFALASPLLYLQEGVRRIELDVYLQDRSSLATDDGDNFIQECGKVFSRYLLSGSGWLSREGRDKLVQKASKFQKELASILDELFEKDWEWLFYSQLKDAFSIHLTTADGWLEITDYVVTPLSDSNQTGQIGVKLIFELQEKMSPIVPWMPAVHGDRFKTEHPLLRCCINPQSNFCPYSLFQGFVIDKLGLQVDVNGLNQVLVYNNHGQLDPSKPFQPFGPLPTCNSYLIIGNYEIAKKRLTDLSLNLEWGDLPTGEGGLSEHYRHYPGDYRDSSFKGRFEALVDGRWHIHEGMAVKEVRLFDDRHPAPGGRQQRRLKVNLCGDLKPIDPRVTEASYAYGLRTRNGFFRLALAEPESAFGHTRYPQLLTQSLMQNVRLKRPQETPNPPYTPVVNRISLNYRAAVQLRPSDLLHDAPDSQPAGFYHIHPFGIQAIDDRLPGEPLHLFPQYVSQGNLFIGIQAGSLSGTLNLLFHLAEDLEQERVQENPVIEWFYLTEQGWRSLAPARIQADTTEGFLTTGIVTLDIPPDIAKGKGMMPGDLYWLRLSTDNDLRGFSRCHTIQPHAVKLARDLSAAHSLTPFPPEPAKWQAMVTVPGIDRFRQIGKVIPGRQAETEDELIVRLSERLRHKNRALTPWDYEHLILAHFPQVAKVKCFSHMQSADDRNNITRPGAVLVVVVPRWGTDETEVCNELMLSAVELRRMRSFLQQHASPFVRIEVRNPVYERVQVRCRVKFSGGYQAGYFVNRLNRDISGFICPWQPGGYHARFGWRIRKKDIESHLQALDYVEFITKFSMLHITRNEEGRYGLDDTARDSTDPEVQIEPSFPWSLALPASQHFIETTSSAETIPPNETGIDELEVGTTFIITGGSGNA